VLNCKANKEKGEIKQLLLQKHCSLMISKPDNEECNASWQ
jgi:hypothetical protein